MVEKKAKTTKKIMDEVKKEIKKRMVKVSFTGKELLEGRVFDTTHLDEAKKFGIFDEKRKYGPITIVLGEMEMLPKVEKELQIMKTGDKKIVNLSAKEAFGERDSRFVIVMPLKSFIDQKINPVPGLIIRGEMNGHMQTGKVQSVSGGRVRVDFNHPLSGREIEYEIKIEEDINDKKEIAQEIFNKYYSSIPGAKKEIKKDELYITLSSDSFKNLKRINDAIEILGKELGIKILFKEDKTKKSKDNNEEKVKSSQELKNND
jgi:FKBP-type peptidyl-prolyl cis-trans isomerase 2